MKRWKTIGIILAGLLPYYFVKTFIKGMDEIKASSADSTRNQIQKQIEILDYNREELTDYDFDSTHGLKVEKEVQELKQQLDEQYRRTNNGFVRKINKNPRKKEKIEGPVTVIETRRNKKILYK